MAEAVTAWRCMVKGCRIYGVLQHVTPGEEYIADTTDKRSHYMTAHGFDRENDYRRRLVEQRAAREEEFRRTGVYPPPKM